MRECVIYPVPLFRMIPDMSKITWRLNIGKPLTVGCYIWYIAGTREKIVVDAGGSNDLFSGDIATPFEQIQTLDDGLNKLGTAPEEIDLVIITHLHLDHIANASRFTKAKILVQRDELESALDPHPMFASMYSRQFLDGLKFETISGDAKISEEISVIRTPGHSTGGQSVSVNTSQGTVVIAGICVCRENFEPSPPLSATMPVIIPTIHTNPFQVYDSMLRIKEMADIVVPIHDSEYEQGGRIP